MGRRGLGVECIRETCQDSECQKSRHRRRSRPQGHDAESGAEDSAEHHKKDDEGQLVAGAEYADRKLFHGPRTQVDNPAAHGDEERRQTTQDPRVQFAHTHSQQSGQEPRQAAARPGVQPAGQPPAALVSHPILLGAQRSQTLIRACGRAGCQARRMSSMLSMLGAGFSPDPIARSMHGMRLRKHVQPPQPTSDHRHAILWRVRAVRASLGKLSHGRCGAPSQHSKSAA